MLISPRASAQYGPACEQWRETPLVPSFGSMTYDAHRRVSVYLTRQSVLPGALSQTWEWDGSLWRLRDTGGLAARASSDLCYDSARRVCIVLGDDGRMWRWNGETWSASAASGIAPRSFAGMVFDSRRNVAVVFGGRFGTQNTDELWEFNGHSWIQRTMARPTARFAHTMVFDADRGVTVLFGGHGNAGGLDQVWEYDGDEWTLKLDDWGAYWAVSAAYDTVRKRVVTWGGEPSALHMLWDGRAWTQPGGFVVKGALPFFGFSHLATAMTYDIDRECLVFHGGSAWLNSAHILLDRTWELTSEGVLTVRVTPPPAQEQQALMVYDTQRQRRLLLDRMTAGRVWEYDALLERWSAKDSTGPLPQNHGGAAAVFDSHRGVTVLFGGGNAGAMVNELWEWKSGSWTQRIEAGPSARRQHAMTFDEARGETIVFGGEFQPNSFTPATLFNETWAWNGTAWRRASTSGPTPRKSAAIAFDPVREVVVLFGGTTSNAESGLLGDTWEWNGRAWTPIVPEGASPAPRRDACMAYDADRERIVLIGGVGPLIPNSGNTRSDVWEWDGRAWIARGEVPTTAFASSLVFDSSTGRLALTLGSMSAMFGHYEFGDDLRFTRHPAPLRVLLGQSARFIAEATSAAAIAWQWRKDGRHLPGKDQPVLLIEHVADGDVGVYDVVAQTICGSIVSPGAELSIGQRCPANVAPPSGDAMIGVSDLLTVIVGWGECPTPPASCPDVNADGVVNATDLLLIVGAWGACVD